MGRTSQIPPELAAEMTPAVRAFVESLFARIDELERRVLPLEILGTELKTAIRTAHP